MQSEHNKFIKIYAKKLMAHNNKIVTFELDWFYRPDIIAIDIYRKVTEYEVKIGEQSLVNELVIATKIFNEGYTPDSTYNKYDKHALYLKSVQHDDRSNIRPNKFYWVVPYSLYVKYKEQLTALPYGIVIINDNGKTVKVKQAEAIHDEPINTDSLWMIAFSLSNRLTKET